MASDIKIVIRGEDDFSPVFDALDGSLEKLARSGDQAQQVFGDLDGAFSEMAGSADAAGQMAAGFAETMAESFNVTLENQVATLEELAAQQVEATTELGENLLAIDAEFQETRRGQQNLANSQLRQETAASQEQMLRSQQVTQEQWAMMEQQFYLRRLQFAVGFFQAVATLASSHSRSMAGLAKNLGVAHALIDSYRAATRALADVPYPFNFAAAALVLAEGLANVQRIREVSVAHGGLDFVPTEQTFLLNRGERVLSPGQNRDLTEFLDSGGGGEKGGGVVIQNMEIHILENATSADSLLEMDQEEMRRVVAEKIIPTLDELASLGIQPGFVENNT